MRTCAWPHRLKRQFNTPEDPSATRVGDRYRSTAWTTTLRRRPRSAHKVEDGDNDRNDDQDVDEPRRDVEGDESQQPQNQKDDRDGEQHRSTSAARQSNVDAQLMV